MNVSRPCEYAIALAACPATAHQVDYLVFAFCTQAVVKALSEIARIAVAYFQYWSRMVAIVIEVIGTILRLGFIQPEELDPVIKIVFLHRIPDKLPRLRVGGVKESGVAHKIEVDLHAAIAGHQPAFGFHLRKERATRFHGRPDRHHEPDAHGFQLFYHRPRIRPVDRIETPGSLIGPMEEIDNHH